MQQLDLLSLRRNSQLNHQGTATVADIALARSGIEEES
jgi:hypothetical protein